MDGNTTLRDFLISIAEKMSELECESVYFTYGKAKFSLTLVDIEEEECQESLSQEPEVS